MIDLSLLHTIEQWGYFVLPKTRTCSPGFGGLLIAIREQPTHLHYDPESVELRIAEQGGAVWTMLRLSTPIHGTRQVRAGRVIVTDRLGKRVDFYTFGATLKASYGESEVIFSLNSQAPVLQVDEGFDGTSCELATEAEMVIGKLQAIDGRNKEGAPHHLDCLDACALYQMSLERLLQKYEKQYSLRLTRYGTYTMLMDERRWLREHGQWQTVNPLERLRFSKG